MKNGDEHRQEPPDGAVRERSEFQHPNGTWIKRDRETGRFMNVSRERHKGVRDEKK